MILHILVEGILQPRSSTYYLTRISWNAQDAEYCNAVDIVSFACLSTGKEYEPIVKPQTVV
jgi:hypothetical protein